MSEPNRITVAQLIWSLEQGGAEQVVMNIALGLDREVFEPVVICLNQKGAYASVLEAEGIKVIELHKRAGFSLEIIGRIADTLKSENVQILHTHLFTGNLWGRLAALKAGVPVICTEHNMDVWKSRFHFLSDRILKRFTRKVIFVSQKVREFYEDKAGKFGDKGLVIYNGIHVSRFDRASEANSEAGRLIRARYGVQPDEVVIGIVGRLVPQKRHGYFISLVKKLRDQGSPVKGLIVGDGPLREELEKAAKQHSVEKEIVFAGFQTKMEAFYVAMDIFCLCSSREGFPMTLLEAMAASLPAVVTDVGGNAECIGSPEIGTVVPFGDDGAFEKGIKALVNDPDIRSRTGCAAREYVSEKFTTERMVAHHQELYRSIVK